MTSVSRHRGMRTDDGFVAGAEALIFGVLILVIGSLMVVNAWAVIDARFAATAVAREAVRAAVEAGAGHDLRGVATGAAIATVVAHGRSADSLTVTVVGPATPVRCAPVEVQAAIDVRLVGLPLPGVAGGGRSGATVTVRSQHREVIDPFRSGHPVGQVCPW